MHAPARVAHVSLLIAVFLGASARAQTPSTSELDALIGRPVESITLSVEGRETRDPLLIEIIETPAGKPLDLAAVRETVLHLFTLGRFEDVQVHADAAGNGVAVRYDLIPLHTVSRIAFRGSLGIPEDRVRDIVRARFGATPPVGRAAEAVALIEEFYKDNGFLSPRVSPSSEVNHQDETTTLVFTIDSGQQAQVGSVELEGDPLMLQQDFLRRLALAPGAPFNPQDLARRMARQEEVLRNQRHYEADISYRTQPRDAMSVAVTVVVRPGRVVSVRFEGDDLPADVREDLVPVRQEGSVDEDLLEDSSNRIAEYLREQGYWKAQVEHRRIEDGENLTVVFTVKRGPQYRVQNVEISGNTAVATTELTPILTLKHGAPFVESRLDADVRAITEHYRRLGYASVKVDSAVAETPGGGDAIVRITIAEGVATRVGTIAFTGVQAIPVGTLRRGVQSVPGQPFYAGNLVADRDAVLLEYVNEGYQNATVDARSEFSPDRAFVDITFDVTEGPQIIVDHILIVGNTRTSTRTIQNELLLKPGQPLGVDDLVESQRRIRGLGLFRRVRITEVAHSGRNTRDVIITVEEAPPTSIGYGGGIEASRRLRRSSTDQSSPAVERLEFAPRGFFEIGRRNLWGKNRAVNVFTRVSLRPSDNIDEGGEDGSGFGFSEYRVLGSFREPRTFGWNAEATITGFLEQAIRSSFNFSRRGVHAQVVRRLTRDISATAQYALNRTKLFDERFNPAEKPLIDRLFPQVRLSSVSAALVRDTRDEPLDPAAGGLIGVDAQLAARGLGSEVGFAKTLMQAFVYRRVPGFTRLVFAGGARLGLAAGFARDVPVPERSVDEIPASERFFAGGDTTVRGFALDRLGEPATIDQAGFPKGGNALIILNSELRMPVWRDLGGVVFIDGGNVFNRIDTIDFGRLRGSVGFGARYKSPIGPVRVDLGFKLSRQVYAGELERRTAVHISIGHAF